LLLALFLLLAIEMPIRRRFVVIRHAAFSTIFFVLLLLIFRVLYFGHLLPLPWYVKGGVWSLDRVPAIFSHNMEVAMPMLVTALGASLVRATRRTALAVLSGTALSNLPWLMVSDAQNVFGRFQYAMVPLLCAIWGSLLSGQQREMRRLLTANWQRLSLRPALAVFVASMLTLMASVYYCEEIGAITARTHVPRFQGTARVGAILHEYRLKGYSIATSEAGIVPLLSEWTALDAWGLNDTEVALGGGLRIERLEKFAPDVVMFNVNDKGFNIPDASLDAAWMRMIGVLQLYVARHGYRLVAAFENRSFMPGTFDFYFIAPQLFEADMVAKIRDVKYSYFGVVLSEFSNDATRVRQALGFSPPRAHGHD